MQRHPHCPLAHREFLRGVLDRRAIDRDRLQHVALTRRQGPQLGFDLAGRHGLRDRSAGSVSGESSMLTNTPPAAAAQRIDQLVCGRSQTAMARTGRWRPQVCRFRCTANKMSCTMSRIDPPVARPASSRVGAAARSTRRDGLEQAMIRRIVA